MVDARRVGDVPEGVASRDVERVDVSESEHVDVSPLQQRLQTVSPYLLGSFDGVEPHRSTGVLASALARAVRSPADVWLLIVAFTGVFPTLEEHAAVRRALALAAGSRDDAVLYALLTSTAPVLRRAADLDTQLELVDGAVVVDATFTGRSDHNTGVQRVVREAVSRWSRSHELVLAGWNGGGTALQRLAGREVRRVLHWPAYSALSGEERAREERAGEERAGEERAGEERDERARRELAAASAGAAAASILVPWRSVIVDIEVTPALAAPALAALAAVSGNRVGLVGHDTIPVVDAQHQDEAEIERFARFLTVVKHADRVAAVSESAAREFAGFVSAVRAQGVPGPDVVAIPLAMNPPSHATLVAVGTATEPAAAGVAVAGRAAEPPLILVVGSEEPRKNHDVILVAAQRLWQRNVPFRLRFIGVSSQYAPRFDAEVARLARRGVEVEVLRHAGDTVLLDSYRQARFTVFPSLHEGFGLPVAESLALGIPVLTSDYGSLAEMAAGGGCLTVDPRDGDAVLRAMAALLTDDALIERLRTEAAGRTFRTWDDYAADAWQGLVVPLQSRLVESAPVANGAALAGRAVLNGASAERDAASAEQAIERWWGAELAARERARAAERSLRGRLRRVAALGEFYRARSREEGQAVAAKAALGIVGRRVVGLVSRVAPAPLKRHR